MREVPVTTCFIGEETKAEGLITCLQAQGYKVEEVKLEPRQSGSTVQLWNGHTIPPPARAWLCILSPPTHECIHVHAHAPGPYQQPAPAVVTHYSGGCGGPKQDWSWGYLLCSGGNTGGPGFCLGAKGRQENPAPGLPGEELASRPLESCL